MRQDAGLTERGRVGNHTTMKIEEHVAISKLLFPKEVEWLLKHLDTEMDVTLYALGIVAMTVPGIIRLAEAKDRFIFDYDYAEGPVQIHFGPENIRIKNNLVSLWI